jgi:DNA-binding NarL/FixJ family response regulator
MSIKILLADDHRIFRESLSSLLDQQTDIEIIAQANNGQTAVELAKELLPDVVIMDIGMPDLNGIEATRQILSKGSQIKVIALSMYSDRKFVAEMLKAGARGYLLKDSAAEELIQAIRTVIDEGTYLPPSLTDLVIENYVRNPTKADKSVFSALTPREREVLQLMAEGKSTKQIGGNLHISIKTVETHRLNIMEKLDIHSVAELTKYAVREGLTSLEK